MAKRKRKSLSNKIRFEVFKRDSFRCQYCGRSAPDVILEVDHINPVANGGENDIVNLVTSCKECNSGKGARPLDDNSVIQKQRQQLEELNERREQLEMMLKWRDELDKINDASIDAVEDKFKQATGHTFTKTGRATVSKLIKKFTLIEVLEALQISINQYLQFDRDGKAIPDTVGKTFDFIKGICSVRQNGDSLKDIYYIRAILRNRLQYYDEARITDALIKAKNQNCDMEYIENICKEINCWTEFREFIYDYADIVL